MSRRTKAALAVVPTTTPVTASGESLSPMQTFHRLASDPTVSVEKIERLMALWERAEAKKAESLFYEALSAAQAEMRPIAADAQNPSTRSRYASYAALDRMLRPIYTQHGFGLSFNTEETQTADQVRVTCLVTHRAGHAREYRIDMPADGKGAKGGDVMTKTHATGSAVTYGMRYLLKMIWNIAVGESDDDGNRAGTPTPAEPEGFADWFLDLEMTAETGHAALKAAWEKSSLAYRAYATKYHARAWETLKRKALAGGAK